MSSQNRMGRYDFLCQRTTYLYVYGIGVARKRTAQKLEEFSPDEIKERAVLVGKQDIRQLKKHIIKYWVDHIETILAKHHIKADEIDYVIPHVSSMFFYEKLNDEIAARNIALTKEKWFTNLTSVGNIGSAAIYVALEELIRTKEIKRGNKILLLVPESGRFSYGTVLLSV